MEVILRVLSSVLSVYMLLLFIRILLTWFSGATLGRSLELLKRVTDPYLDIFRRVPFLRTDRIDFSPIAAILSLVIVLNIINTLRLYGTISLGIILALIVSALWSATFFILCFFAILMAARLVSTLFQTASFDHFWHAIDLIVNPLLAFIQRTLFRGRQLSYKTGLGAGVAVAGVTAIVGRLLISVLVGALQRLPF